MDENKIRKIRMLLDELARELDGVSDDDMKAVFEDSNPEDAANVPYGLGNTYWTPKYNGITTGGRFDGAANTQKSARLNQRLARLMELSPLGESILSERRNK